ncbi:hypothetical protein Purlil1_13197 [Purpureocillium lilacinum]|uniref:Uncharacterized protein n=1 Tax=Purpureocillium lilacinum TaxID=33203 RepID=A0ABR0BFE5_PURLI|nr:hypothetical protein Purlil1_13197 [Purpureocillium lilacinum]
MGASCYHLEVLTSGRRKKVAGGLNNKEGPSHSTLLAINTPHFTFTSSASTPKALLHGLEAELLAYSPEELVRIANEQRHWKRPRSTSRPSRPGRADAAGVEPREGANFVREDQCNYFVGALQLFELRWEAVLQQGKITTRPAIHSQAAEC